MTRAGLETLRVRHLHVAELLAGVGQRRRHIGLFDVHVERVADHEHRRAVDGVAETHRVGDGHAHVVLIAVQRLNEDSRARTLGAFRERSQTFEEEPLVFVARTTGRDALKMARASPDRHDDDARAKLASEIQKTGDVVPHGGDLVGVRID